MHNRDNSKHNVITRDTMCVIERQAAGSPHTAYYPISFDAQVMNSLRALGSEMLAWEREQGKELLEAIELTGVKFHGDRDVDVAVRRFRNAVRDVRRLAGIKSDAPLFSTSAHSNWRYVAGVYRLSEHADIIRGFAASRAAIEACREKLEDPDYPQLVNSFNMATALQPILLSALDQYEEAFSSYVGKAEQIYPGLFKARGYCQDFTAAYGDADLDYTMTSGNQCAVEKIGEYYWACVLDRLYDAYEATGSVIAYSHRKRGFFEYTIELDPECDLHLLHETNFGFGSAVYFRSTLSYKGVSAVDASSLIFFRNAGMVSFSNCTFDYDVDEKSFALSFEKAVRLHSEYRSLEEAGFVDKYFRKSLKDLSELLRIVANTDTFLQITTLERLDSLTSGVRNVLLPDEGFKDIEFGLNASEERAAYEFAAAIAADVYVDKFEDSDRVKKLAESLLSNLEESVLRRKKPESNGLQLIVKKDLLRNRVINEVMNLLPDRNNIAASVRVNYVVEKLIPPDEGVYAKKYEGFYLINMRAEKALSVIRPIARLRKIAELTNFEPTVESILATCRQISHQAKSYISGEIDPNLARLQPERDKAKSQLEEAEKQLETLRRKNGDTSWLEKQRQKLKAQFLTLDREVTKLAKQRDALQEYIRTVQSI